jgi:hypothetical protein
MEITNSTYLVLGVLTFFNALLALACLAIASAKKRRQAVTTEDDTKSNNYFDVEEDPKTKKIAFIGKVQPGKRKVDKSKKKKQ